MTRERRRQPASAAWAERRRSRSRRSRSVRTASRPLRRPTHRRDDTQCPLAVVVAEDYAQLLRKGPIMKELPLAQHGPWRAAMRACARQDKLRVRTGSGGYRTVWAGLVDWE